MSPGRRLGSLADLRVAALEAVHGQLGPETIRISDILPDQLNLLQDAEAGYHVQDHRILLSADVWRNLELIVEGSAAKVDPYASFVAVSAYHHEHIHAAGPHRVGRLFGHASIHFGSSNEKDAARMLEEAVIELWNKRHFREFVQLSGLGERDPRLREVDFDARYAEEVEALERLLQALSRETQLDEDDLLALMARHVPDTRPKALGTYLVEKCGAQGTKVVLERRAVDFAENFKRVFYRFDLRTVSGEDVGQTASANLAQLIRGW